MPNEWPQRVRTRLSDALRRSETPIQATSVPPDGSSRPGAAGRTSRRCAASRLEGTRSLQLQLGVLQSLQTQRFHPYRLRSSCIPKLLTSRPTMLSHKYWLHSQSRERCLPEEAVLALLEVSRRGFQYRDPCSQRLRLVFVLIV